MPIIDGEDRAIRLANHGPPKGNQLGAAGGRLVHVTGYGMKI